MTFLNMALLGGVLAFNIPLIIHLFNKSRHKRIDWAAMFLLEKIIKQNRKRIRLEQIIMLLIRCSIPLLLALAMAQPVINGFKALLGDAKGTSVVLVDASYSMQARDKDGAANTTRYDTARSNAQAVMGQMPGGSQAVVARVGGGANEVGGVPSRELDRLSRQLDDSQATLGPVDSPAALRSAIESLESAGTVKRDVVLISDFQRVNWESDSSAERQKLKELLASMAVPPSVMLMPVGTEAGKNLAVIGVALGTETIGVGQRVRIKGRLANTGSVDVVDQVVRLVVDGSEVDRQRVSLKAGQTTEVLFFHRYESGGSHALELVTQGDDLPADDLFRVAVHVIKALPVLMVSGDLGQGERRRPFPEGETDFLEVALQPFAFGITDTQTPLADLVKTTTVGPQDMDDVALRDTRVVVLANVERLDATQAEILMQFVKRGGGLIIFPGDRCDTQWYNTTLASELAMLPATMDGLSGVGLDFDNASRLLEQHHDHPALALWNDPANGSLSQGEVSAWYQLGAQSDATILARLSTGYALMVERSFGEGTVLMFATSADSAWSNLPARAFYLPLMQRLVTYAATRRTSPRNVKGGQPLIATLDQKPDASSATWLLPDGSSTTRPIVKRGERWVCELTDTALPGYYRLDLGESNGRLLFAVNLSRDESNLDALTAKELEELAQAMGATVVQDAEEYAELDQQRRHGRPIWHLLWAALLVLVFGEMFVQQWFGKGGGE